MDIHCPLSMNGFSNPCVFCWNFSNPCHLCLEIIKPMPWFANCTFGLQVFFFWILSCVNLLYFFSDYWPTKFKHAFINYLSVFIVSYLIEIICLWRSLFTPYFKYLLEGSVQYLSEDGTSISSKRKKKAKLEDSKVKHKNSLSGQNLWNLRALILKSLHKCFLYDNDQKILDSSNFQVSFFCIIWGLHVRTCPLSCLSCFRQPLS